MSDKKAKEAVLPSEPSEEALKAMDCICATSDIQRRAIYNALFRHLTAPKIKTVNAWIVTYWSLSAERTVAQVVYSEERADRLVEGNGETASKLHTLVRIWTDRKTALREGEELSCE